MVKLYVDGMLVGTLADAERVIPELLARNRRVELRDESGAAVGTLLPSTSPPAGEPLVPWDPTITREELERRAAAPGYPIDEVRKMLGWAK
jgi:hypothetical protein